VYVCVHMSGTSGDMNVNIYLQTDDVPINFTIAGLQNALFCDCVSVSKVWVRVSFFGHLLPGNTKGINMNVCVCVCVYARQPQNVFLTFDSKGRPCAKIGDFGHSRLMKCRHHTRQTHQQEAAGLLQPPDTSCLWSNYHPNPHQW